MSLDDRFESALAHLLDLEGGFVDHESDRGGRTNYGVTQASYRRWLATRGVSERDVKDITEGEVKELYFSGYWRRGECHQLAAHGDVLCVAHFDSCVNHGVGQSTRFLQRAIGAPEGWVDPIIKDVGLGKETFAHPWDDGKLGPATLARVAEVIGHEPDEPAIAETNERTIVLKLFTQRLAFYEDLWTRDPTQLVFAKGWFNRIKKLAAFLEVVFEVPTPQTKGATGGKTKRKRTGGTKGNAGT